MPKLRDYGLTTEKTLSEEGYAEILNALSPGNRTEFGLTTCSLAEQLNAVRELMIN